MQILTIRKGFEALESEFYQFESIRQAFKAFECQFEPFGLNNSNQIWSIRMQIKTRQTIFEAFESKF